MQVGRSCVVSSAWCACLLLLFSTLSARVTEVGSTHQSIPPSVVKLWASAFGGEMKSISAKYSGSQLLQKKYKEFERAVRVEEIDGLRLVKRLAEDMEEMFHKKAQAMKALPPVHQRGFISPSPHRFPLFIARRHLLRDSSLRCCKRMHLLKNV
ncbi:voltage-dependent calcium channel subunit alpha-2/delta-3-like protein [Lates japonicus]|uniref:Voltage-dependent calcium channel subunit alpha-2/delta-3-like protein n=1 Tax=Lates japonicus TaxID=270547 RepID=A0AAD3QUF9_LATJO|nr:voltage-dependent calcium channel subunit alpha-2/delta-3-like protein [Lates japonicus]